MNVLKWLAGVALAAFSCLRAEPNWRYVFEAHEPLSERRGFWPLFVTLTNVPPRFDPEVVRAWEERESGVVVPVPVHVFWKSGGVWEACLWTEWDAGQTRRFRLDRAGGPDVLPSTSLTFRIEGDRLAIQTGPTVFHFDSRSGQLAAYVPLSSGVPQALTFVQERPKPCHWNPDVWVKGRPWGHTSDWDMQKSGRIPNWRAEGGPWVVRFFRRGRMWSADEVEVEVTYTLVAGFPCVLEESRLLVTHAFAAKAIRQNELVFSRGIHTHVVWKEEGGNPETAVLYDPKNPTNFLGEVVSVSPDIPWIGLFHEDRRYGIGVVNQWRRERLPAGAFPFSERARYYALDYGEHGTGERYGWNFAYICRALYWEGLAAEPVRVEGGTVCEEGSVYVVFSLGMVDDKRFEEIQRWSRLWRNPIQVRAVEVF